jgi:hypothetical protein
VGRDHQDISSCGTKTVKSAPVRSRVRFEATDLVDRDRHLETVKNARTAELRGYPNAGPVGQSSQPEPSGAEPIKCVRDIRVCWQRAEGSDKVVGSQCTGISSGALNHRVEGFDANGFERAEPIRLVRDKASVQQSEEPLGQLVGTTERLDEYGSHAGEIEQCFVDIEKDDGWSLHTPIVPSK